MNTNWIGRQAAEHGQAVRRCLAALVFAAVALAAALPAQAFQKTSFADGSFEYFFAAPSLRIETAGDLDLHGLSFIEGIEGGFRVGALFNLDWLGGEQAALGSPASTWSGIDSLPRSLSIIAGGSIDFSTVLLSLDGGSISLVAGSTLSIGDGSAIDVGDSGAIPVNGGGSSGVVRIGDPNVTLQPTIPVMGGGTITIQPGDNLDIRGPSPGTNPITGGGTLLIKPGGGIILTGPTILTIPIILIVPSPIPEPTSAALLLAGLAGLAGVFGRRARAGR